jgi:hypothetical protein
MRDLNKCATLFVTGLIILQMGCKKDSGPVESTPPPYIDSYTVNLLDTAGTTYEGNYFPLNEGDFSYFSGEQTVTTTMTGSQPSTETDPISGMFDVLAKRLVALSSGADSLYPVIDMTNAGPDTTRYFKKDTIAVYIKAFKLADGTFYEVVNPVFIKSKLVTGDTWEAAPQMDMTKLLASQLSSIGAQSDLTINARSKFFVVGKEVVTLAGLGDRYLVRLEQANDISVSGTVTYQTTVYNLQMSSKFATVYHLLADTGIVHQNLTGSMRATLSGMGSVNMNISKCELTLTSRFSSQPKILFRHLASSTIQSSSLNKKTESNMRNISEKIMKEVIRVLSFR